MEILRDVFLILHFIGLAAVIGGFLVQTRTRTKVVHAAMLHGALTQLVSGLVLVTLLEMGDGDVNHMKIGVKLIITVVVTALAWRYRKARSVPTWVWGSIGGLAALNVVIAVVW